MRGLQFTQEKLVPDGCPADLPAERNRQPVPRKQPKFLRRDEDGSVNHRNESDAELAALRSACLRAA